MRVKAKSHFNELSENGRKGDVRRGGIAKKEGQSVKLLGDQNSGPKALPKSKRWRERKEQRRYQGSSDCQRSDGEE